ncbi:MAG: hypothetical protein NTZ18_00895 [Candidatus Komeilibacteria bacterium]|nr:hypothetical protein [Candidatus Komeilibacteria bacterium]
MKKPYLILIILFALGVFVRLGAHPANFAPIGAIALFAGVYLPKKWAIILPVITMLVGDIFLGFYDLRLTAVVYGCFILTGLVGLMISKHKNAFTVLTAVLGSSLFFFLATNFAVWAFSPWYPHNAGGLMLCYGLAVPFFRNSLFGDLFFSGLLFGAYELAELRFFNALWYNKGEEIKL